MIEKSAVEVAAPLAERIVRPPSPRVVRVLGHPLHAMLTDFPIGFLTLSFVWDIVGLFRQEPTWWTMAFWTMAAGLIMAVPTALVGLIDFLRLLKERHVGARTAVFHMVVMGAAVVCFLASLLVRGSPTAPPEITRALPVVLSACGVAIAVVGLYLGGELVYGYGVGQEAEERMQ